MLRKSGKWDARCTNELVEYFPVRLGYWFKVSREQARELVDILARAYGVHAPLIDERTPKPDRGWYVERSETISIWPRAHIKTVFHEFYHHLEKVTRRKYDSSDRLGYAWQFADRLFNILRQNRGHMDMAKEKKPEIAHSKKLSDAEVKTVKGQIKKLIENEDSKPPEGRDGGAVHKTQQEPATVHHLHEAKKKQAEKNGAKSGGAWLKENAAKKLHLLVEGNPHREGTTAYKSFECFKEGATVEEVFTACEKAGADFGYLRGSIEKRKNIQLK